MNLSFRIGRVPVRLLPSFFITTVVINLGLAQTDPRRLLLWALIVLGSVLIHELGHAVAALAYGLQPRIELHGFGGTTSWASSSAVSGGRRIVISIAGPAFGFVAGACVVVAQRAFGGIPDGALGEFAYRSLVFVNIGWGVLNLIPMLPLDGGSVMTHTLDLATKGRGERPARVVSLVVAVVATLAALVAQWWWPALVAASFIASNWRGLKESSARDHDAPMRASLEGAYAALEAKDGSRIVSIARPVALGSRTAAVRAEALQLLAFGFLLEGRVADADAAIVALPAGFSPHPTFVAMRTELSTARPPAPGTT